MGIGLNRGAWQGGASELGLERNRSAWGRSGKPSLPVGYRQRLSYQLLPTDVVKCPSWGRQALVTILKKAVDIPRSKML